MGDDPRVVPPEELRDSCNAVADDVLQEATRQLPHPVAPVLQKRLRIPRVAEIVAVIALHVDDRIAKVPGADQVSHTSRGVTELSVVPNRQPQLPPLRQLDQRLGFSRVECEGLLHVDVTLVLHAVPGDREMALWRCGDMHDVRPRLLQERAEVVEVSFDLESLSKLPGHELFTV